MATHVGCLRLALGTAIALSALVAPLPTRAADAIQPTLDEALRAFDGYPLRTGVLYDRVLPLSGIEHFDGSAASRTATLGTWRQMYDELRRAATPAPATRGLVLPAPGVLAGETRASLAAGVIPLAVLDVRYERLEAGAVSAFAPVLRAGHFAPGEAPLHEQRAFAATALVARTYRGADVRFVLARDHWFTNDPRPLARIEIDFADGAGFRTVREDEATAVRYDEPGEKTLQLRATRTDGSVARASFAFPVEGLAAPTPDDTLHITATIPYLGQFGTGDAYVRLAPGHTVLTNPVVVVEGFDLDNSMNWDELYTLLNQQGLADSVAAAGFDAVVLNFTDATDYVQKNSFVVAELIQQVEAAVAPTTSIAVVGASMGGLCSRYALAWFESHAIPHRVRTWISFDAPHAGADIPLGVQYWVDFFSGQSADAAAFRDILNRPAARQMLVYHYTTPPGATGQPDPLRAAMLADFTAAGDYPTLPRLVSIADGSSTQQNQGFLPGDQLIQWNYTSGLVDITGNVWAVPNLASHIIFDGKIRILFSTTTRSATVSGTQPYDGAPGGWRSSLADMDAVAAPFGDIVALHPNHCFVPTISALAIATGDPFYDVAGDPSLLSHTPFDAIYYPTANQEHVEVTAQSAPWILAELGQGLVGVAPAPLDVSRGLHTFPNPFHAGARVAFTLPRAERVALGVYGVDGREVRTLARGTLPAGAHELVWDGRDARGGYVPAGIYFLRLQGPSRNETHRIVKID